MILLLFCDNTENRSALPLKWLLFCETTHPYSFALEFSACTTQRIFPKRTNECPRCVQSVINPKLSEVPPKQYLVWKVLKIAAHWNLDGVLFKVLFWSRVQWNHGYCSRWNLWWSLISLQMLEYEIHTWQYENQNMPSLLTSSNVWLTINMYVRIGFCQTNSKYSGWLFDNSPIKGARGVVLNVLFNNNSSVLCDIIKCRQTLFI